MIRNAGHLFSKSIRKWKFSTAWNWLGCRAMTLLPFWVLAEILLHTLCGEKELHWYCRGTKSAGLISAVFCLCHWLSVRVCTISSHVLFFCRRNQKHLSMEEVKILPKYFLWIVSGPGLWKSTCPKAGVCPYPKRTQRCPKAVPCSYSQHKLLHPGGDQMSWADVTVSPSPLCFHGASKRPFFLSSAQAHQPANTTAAPCPAAPAQWAAECRISGHSSLGLT